MIALNNAIEEDDEDEDDCEDDEMEQETDQTNSNTTNENENEIEGEESLPDIYLKQKQDILSLIHHSEVLFFKVYHLY